MKTIGNGGSGSEGQESSGHNALTGTTTLTQGAPELALPEPPAPTNEFTFERFSYAVGDFGEMVGPVRIDRAELETVFLEHGLLLVDLQELASKALEQAEELGAYKAAQRAKGETVLELSERVADLEQREASLLDDIEQLKLEGLESESVNNGEDSDDVCTACRKALDSEPHTRQDCVAWALARERDVANLELEQLKLERDTWKETARTRGDTVIKLAEKLCSCETELETATIRGRELVEEAELKADALERQITEAERVRVELEMDLQFGRVPAEYREVLTGHVKWLREATLPEKG